MLKRLLLVVVAFASLVSVSNAADPLKLNKDKSKIGFVGKKTDGKHAGGFKDFSVDAQADWEDPTKSSLAIDIKTDSLWSDDAKLTEHLKNPDFFDVRKYPSMKFTSTKIEVSGEHEAVILGKLKMLDKEVEVKVPCSVEANDSSVTLNAKFKIDRTLWGMSYGAGKIDKEVDIDVSLQFAR
ncbi:MAG: YceI family protein [Pirellulales bacterium]